MALTQEQINRILGKQSVVDRVLSTNAIEQRLNAPENIVTGGILPIQKNKVTGQMALAMPEFIKSIQQAYTAPARAMRGEFDPNSVQGVQEANNVALNLLGVGSAPAIGKPRQQGSLGINAYQGSPNLFDRFDKSKIGSGSGVDYGFGGYFSESPSVASRYMGNEGEYITTVDNKVVDTPIIKSIIRMGGKPEEFIKILNNKLQTQKELLNKASKEEVLAGISDYDIAKLDYNSTLSKLDEAKSYLGKDIKHRPSGNLYKVDIPDETLPYYLNWESDNQTPEVISILKNAGIYQPFQRGENLYFNAIDKIGSSDAQKSGFQKASEYLNSIGIKGNKYTDRTYGTVAKNPTNYVVYDPETIKILERNGLLLP